MLLPTEDSCWQSRKAQEVRGEAIGCVALRRFDQSLRNEAALCAPCVSRQGRRSATGQIADRGGATIGYQRMLLDTLPSMKEAHKLYRTLGFREIPAYQKNPIPESLFFELLLK